MKKILFALLCLFLFSNDPASAEQSKKLMIRDLSQFLKDNCESVTIMRIWGRSDEFDDSTGKLPEWDRFVATCNHEVFFIQDSSGRAKDKTFHNVEDKLHQYDAKELWDIFKRALDRNAAFNINPKESENFDDSYTYHRGGELKTGVPNRFFSSKIFEHYTKK